MVNKAPIGGASGAPANGSLQPGASGSSNAKKKVEKPKPGTLVVKGGSRQIKGYTVTGDELLSLGIAQGGATVFFTLAGSCFGFWLSVRQAVELAGRDALAIAIAKWQAYGDVAFYASGALAVVGLVAIGFSGWQVRNIKKGTIHD